MDGVLETCDLLSTLQRHGLVVVWAEPGAPIPGSHWGAPEAGLIGNRLYLREDTPLHSALHEACHYVCMDDERRRELHTDAGGCDLEEAAVCYLQVLLAEQCGAAREAFMESMDAWGYSFRLGSTREWFENDAADARAWLLRHGLIDPLGVPTLKVRSAR